MQPSKSEGLCEILLLRYFEVFLEYSLVLLIYGFALMIISLVGALILYSLLCYSRM